MFEGTVVAIGVLRNMSSLWDSKKGGSGLIIATTNMPLLRSYQGSFRSTDIRYMDDILIFAPTRWKLRHAIRVLNQTFAELGVEQHPNKTFIGRTARGFDFLGYHVAPEGVTLAAHTIRRMNRKALRLYEQEPQDAPARVQRLGVYLMRWRRWTRAGLRVAGRHSNP